MHDGRLVVERGVLRRSLTVVPMDRIRGVDVHASALQRLLGIVSVRVDAAATGGREDEAVLNAVSSAEGARLRDVLLREAALGEHEPVPVEPTARGPGPASGAGAGRGAGAVPPAVAALRAAGRRLPAGPAGRDRRAGQLRRRAAGAAAGAAVDDEDALGTEPGVRAIVVGAVAVVLVAVAGAMVTAAVANWGFTLTRRGGTLVAERGLLSRRQVSLEHDRIRGYALAEPLALRAVAAARLTALVTGLGGGENENESRPARPAAPARPGPGRPRGRRRRGDPVRRPLRRAPGGRPAPPAGPGGRCPGWSRPRCSAGRDLARAGGLPGCWPRSGSRSAWTGTPGSGNALDERAV